MESVKEPENGLKLKSKPASGTMKLNLTKTYVPTGYSSIKISRLFTLTELANIFGSNFEYLKMSTLVRHPRTSTFGDVGKSALVSFHEEAQKYPELSGNIKLNFGFEISVNKHYTSEELLSLINRLTALTGYENCLSSRGRRVFVPKIFGVRSSKNDVLYFQRKANSYVLIESLELPVGRRLTKEEAEKILSDPVLTGLPCQSCALELVNNVYQEYACKIRGVTPSPSEAKISGESSDPNLAGHLAEALKLGGD